MCERFPLFQDEEGSGGVLMSELKAIGIRWKENGELHFSHVYPKSEADKVIARHKYKRCLANANYWVAISYHCVDDKHRKKAEKRHYKWLELAEKFKEAK